MYHFEYQNRLASGPRLHQPHHFLQGLLGVSLHIMTPAFEDKPGSDVSQGELIHLAGIWYWTEWASNFLELPQLLVDDKWLTLRKLFHCRWPRNEDLAVCRRGRRTLSQDSFGGPHWIFPSHSQQAPSWKSCGPHLQLSVSVNFEIPYRNITHQIKDCWGKFLGSEIHHGLETTQSIDKKENKLTK